MWKSTLKVLVLLITAAIIQLSSIAPINSNSYYKAPLPQVIYQVDGNHPPFEFASGESVYGFGMDLGRTIFSVGNFNVQYSSDTWSNVYDKVKSGQVDICGLIAMSDRRKKEILFTKPVVRSFRAIYAKKDLEVEKITDIAKYRIGVQKSDYSESILQNELNIKNYQTYKDLEECIYALKEGKIDIILGNQEVTNYLLVKQQLSSEIIPHILNLYPVDLAFGVSKDRPELVTFMNEQIDKLQKSGLYEQAFQKYFYRHSEYYKANQQRTFIYIGLLLLFAIVTTVIVTHAFIKQLSKMVDQTTSSLKKEQELLRTTLLSIRDGVVAVSAEGRVTFMNHAAEQLTGLDEKESINKHLNEVLNIVDPENGNRFEVPLTEVLKTGTPINFNSLNILIAEGGSQHLILGSASPIENDLREVTGVLVAFQDISEKKQAEETIRYHEYYDSLTDLPNRKLFHQYLNSAIESAFKNKQNLSVLIIDLDYFKNINDTLGHDIGDILLKQVAERLVRTLEENDILARMGGDEFTILIPEVAEKEQVYRLARKVIEKLSHAYIIDQHELYITASIGIALYPDDGLEPAVIMKHADTALYNAKENGRNTYQGYIMSDDKKVMEKFSLIKDLRTAIEHDEMLLYYQPKIDGISGMVIGMEALIRWNHPEKGIISPGVFIPLAEDTGYINQLDTWVLRTACSQFKQFSELNYKPLRLSVNLSAYQFRKHNLVDTIAVVLNETGFKPNNLELEITETTAMENIDFTIKTLKRLNEMGVNISIDDFGTGYSSLSYLRYFPIHILKIDRSFICDMEKDQNTKAIVKSIIDVAHSLKLRVTAEGVETEEQLNMLKQMGCDEIQGFLISKPLPLMEIKNNMLSNIG